MSSRVGKLSKIRDDKLEMRCYGGLIIRPNYSSPAVGDDDEDNFYVNGEKMVPGSLSQLRTGDLLIDY